MTAKTSTYLLVVTRSTDDPDLFVCTSKDHQVSAESHNAEDAINFVKGATLCAIGGLWKEIPDELTVRFEVNRSVVPHCDFELGLVPGVLPCKKKPTFKCGCDRCSAEEPFRSCAEHRADVELRHERVYPNPRHRVVWYSTR